MIVKILAGASGAGKSTLIGKLDCMPPEARVLRTLQICDPDWDGFYAGDVLILSADHITFDDDGSFHVERLGGAHATCISTFGDILRLEEKDRPTVMIVDNTNTSPWEIAPYVAMAMAAEDVELGIMVLERDWRECHGRNVHDTPEYAIRQQARRLSRTLDDWPVYWPKPVLL